MQSHRSTRTTILGNDNLLVSMSTGNIWCQNSLKHTLNGNTSCLIGACLYLHFNLLSNLLSIKHVMTILQQDFSLPHPPTINFQLDLTSLAAAALIITTFQKWKDWKLNNIMHMNGIGLSCKTSSLWKSRWASLIDGFPLHPSIWKPSSTCWQGNITRH